jgi:hypothetical protein
MRVSKISKMSVAVKIVDVSAIEFISLVSSRPKLAVLAVRPALRASTARRILQHAWAEIEHDIQYKAVGALPTQVRRRFTALAGLVEIADRELQAIEDEDRRIRAEARRSVDNGQLDRVEITADSLQAYLDRKYGPDRRMSLWSCGWAASLLLRLGFSSLGEVDRCIGEFDDDLISRTLHGARQEQMSRFEDVLLASMGQNSIERHPWVRDGGASWFESSANKRLQRLRQIGVEIGEFVPAHPARNNEVLDLTESHLPIGTE